MAAPVVRSGRFTLRRKLVAIGAAGVVLMGLVVQAAVGGLREVTGDDHELALATRAQQLHQDADTMFHALRADAYNAVLAGSGRSADSGPRALAQFTAHAHQYEQDLKAIEALHLPGSLGRALSGVALKEASYIAAATQLAQVAATDAGVPEAELKSFERGFDLLEVELAGVTGAVAQAADNAEAEARRHDTGAERQVIAVSVVALLGLLTMALLLSRLGQRLTETLLQLERSEERSRRFLAYAAHQLRTPITATRSSAEALLMEGGTPEQEALLTMLIDETGRAGRLVSALLRMARLDQGDVPPMKPGHVADVVEVCERELGRIEVQAPELTWRLEVDSPTARPILMSPEATSEVLANLLDNAARHAHREVVVRVTSTPGELRVSVEDDGPGLPKEARSSAFERFVSLDGHGGSGLGLPIARALARAQGGGLDYDGRRFVLTLACRPVDPSLPQERLDASTTA